MQTFRAVELARDPSATPEPLLEAAAAPAAAWLGSQPTALVLFIAVALILAAAIATALWWWHRLGPAERAFLACALRAGLSRRDRALLRTAAAAAGLADPVVVLLSTHAFDRAAQHAQSADQPRLRALRLRLGT